MKGNKTALQIESSDVGKNIDYLVGKFTENKDAETVRITISVEIIPKPKNLTTNQALDLIGCGRTHLHTLVKDGVIQKVQIVAGKKRYDRQEIETLINEGRL